MIHSGVLRLVVCATVTMLLVLSGLTASAAGPSPEVQQVAEEGLTHFLTVIPPAQLALMGLQTSDDIKSARLGSPYEEVTILPAALASYQAAQPLTDVVTHLDTWLYPVMVGAEARAIVTVAIVQGRWQAGAFGQAPMAHGLQAGEARLPQMLTVKGLSTTYDRQLLRIFLAHADFLAVNVSGSDYLLPLMANPNVLSLQADTLLTPEQVLPQLNTIVQENLKSQSEGGEAPSRPDSTPGPGGSAPTTNP